MKQKLALIIALALSVCFVFAACGDKEQSEPKSQGTEVTSSPEQEGEASSAQGGESSSADQPQSSAGGTQSASQGGGSSIEQDPLKDYAVTLTIDDDKDLVILNFTDFQLHDGKSTYTSFSIIDELVETYHPDLITVLGDTAEDDGKYGTKVNFKAICDHINSFDIPWAPVFGNHDNEAYREPNSVKDSDNQWIIDTFLSESNCLFKVGPNNVSGNGNYIVNVVEKNSGKVRKALYFFDSGTQGVDNSHVSFYADAVSYSKALNGGTTPESICFMHIPLPEYRSAVEAENTVGIVGENPSVGNSTTAFFAKIKELGSTKHVICGHDHVNSWYAEYQGVYLMYCLKSSDGDYYNAQQLGGTVFTVSKSATAFNYHFVEPSLEMTNSGSIDLEHLGGWKYSDATFSFDFKPTATLNNSDTVQFSLLGDNLRRSGVSEKDRMGSWNRLTERITINFADMSASDGTITAMQDGWYHYSLALIDAPLNTSAGEVAYGTETMKMIYFNSVGSSFCIKNIKNVKAPVAETNQKDLADATIEPISDQTYIGYPIYPDLTVTYAGEALSFGEDYIAEYTNNAAGGTATVKIVPSGIGAHKWKGSKTATFNIEAPEITIRGEAFDSAANYEKKFTQGEYKTVTFDYYILSGDRFGVALINTDWGCYYGYLRFYHDGTCDVSEGVTVVKNADGYYSVTIDMETLTKAVGTPASKVIQTFFISRNQGDAKGYIDNLSFNA